MLPHNQRVSNCEQILGPTIDHTLLHGATHGATERCGGLPHEGSRPTRTRSCCCRPSWERWQQWRCRWPRRRGAPGRSGAGLGRFDRGVLGRRDRRYSDRPWRLADGSRAFPVIMSFALRACTSLGTQPAASISSTIQYQLPTVSTATGEPRSQRSRNRWSAPRSCAMRCSRTSWPSGRATDASV